MKIPANAELVVLNDRYHALWWLHENQLSVEFVVVKVLWDIAGKPEYEAVGANFNPEADPRRSAQFAYGLLKWDGCLNIMFKECEDKIMLHFCHPSDYAEFGEIGAKLYGLGPKMPSWMG